jgi:hypothetical protein
MLKVFYANVDEGSYNSASALPLLPNGNFQRKDAFKYTTSNNLNNSTSYKNMVTFSEFGYVHHFEPLTPYTRSIVSLIFRKPFH